MFVLFFTLGISCINFCVGFIAIENIFCTKVHQFIDTKVLSVWCTKCIEIGINTKGTSYFLLPLWQKWSVDGASFFFSSIANIFCS